MWVSDSAQARELIMIRREHSLNQWQEPEIWPNHSENHHFRPEIDWQFSRPGDPLMSFWPYVIPASLYVRGRGGLVCGVQTVCNGKTSGNKLTKLMELRPELFKVAGPSQQTQETVNRRTGTSQQNHLTLWYGREVGTWVSFSGTAVLPPSIRKTNLARHSRNFLFPLSGKMILGRFGDDSGTILGRFWDDSGAILGRFWFDSVAILSRPPNGPP